MSAIQIFIDTHDDQNQNPIQSPAMAKKVSKDKIFSKTPNFKLHAHTAIAANHANSSVKGKMTRMALTPARSNNLRPSSRLQGSRFQKSSCDELVLKSFNKQKVKFDENLNLEPMKLSKASIAKSKAENLPLTKNELVLAQENETSLDFENIAIDPCTRECHDEILNLNFVEKEVLDLPLANSPELQKPLIMPTFEKEPINSKTFDISNDSLLDETVLGDENEKEKENNNFNAHVDPETAPNSYFLENFNQLNEKDFPKVDTCSRMERNTIVWPEREILFEIEENSRELPRSIFGKFEEITLDAEEVGCFDL